MILHESVWKRTLGANDTELGSQLRTVLCSSLRFIFVISTLLLGHFEAIAWLSRKVIADLSPNADDPLLSYHAPANGQAERTNQTVETAIGCLLIGHYEENWSMFIHEVEYALNTSENASTGTTPFEVLYGVKPRERLTPLTVSSKNEKDALSFIERRAELRREVHDAIKLSQAKMAINEVFLLPVLSIVKGVFPLALEVLKLTLLFQHDTRFY